MLLLKLVAEKSAPTFGDLPDWWNAHDERCIVPSYAADIIHTLKRVLNRH